MAVDFTQNEFVVRADLRKIWQKHIDLIDEGKYPYDKYAAESLCKYGEYKAIRCVFSDILGDGDYGES